MHPDQLRLRTGGSSEMVNLYTEALLRHAFDGLNILLINATEAVVDKVAGHSAPGSFSRGYGSARRWIEWSPAIFAGSGGRGQSAWVVGC